MYNSFIEFKKNFKFDENKHSQWHFDKNPEDEMFKYWSEHIVGEIESFEIDDCILKDFPLHEQAKLIVDFVQGGWGYGVGDYEITKLIHLLWNEYMLDKDGKSIKYKNRNRSNQFHANIFQNLYTVKSELRAMEYITQDDIWTIWRKDMKHRGRYVNYHLFGCLHLLGDRGLSILKNIIKLNYDDAQSFIMFAIYQYDPKSFYNDLKEILLYWHKHENISFSHGTRMLYELNIIVKKYKKHGVDLVNDSELACIFNDEVMKYFYRYDKNGCFD